MTKSVRTTSILVAALLAIPAMAQETGSSGGSFTDSMRQPGGLYDAAAHTRAPDIQIHGIFGWWYGIGVGARYSHPLVADGFIDGMNDELRLDVGGDFFPFVGLGLVNAGIAFNVGGGVRYVIHLTDKFNVYARAELGYEFENYYGDRIPFYFDIAPGLTYKFTPNLNVRLEAGYKGTRLGIVWAF